MTPEDLIMEKRVGDVFRAIEGFAPDDKLGILAAVATVVMEDAACYFYRFDYSDTESAMNRLTLTREYATLEARRTAEEHRK